MKKIALSNQVAKEVILPFYNTFPKLFQNLIEKFLKSNPKLDGKIQWIGCRVNKDGAAPEEFRRQVTGVLQEGEEFVPIILNANAEMAFKGKRTFNTIEEAERNCQVMGPFLEKWQNSNNNVLRKS